MISISWLTLVALLGAFVILAGKSRLSTKPLPLPPGPPGDFLVGHLRKIPTENTAAAYARWSKEYDSDVIHLRTLGQSIIVLNSIEAAKELLDRRGASTCDRPRFALFEVMGWRKTLTFLPYGSCWQMHRKMLQSTFSNSNVRQWQPFQVQESRRTVLSLITRPRDWEQSLRRFTVAVVVKVSYGTDVLDNEDPYIQIADDAMYAMGNGGAPANSVVDVFPLARFLPDWLVRDWPLQFARDWRWAIQKLHRIPFAAAHADVVNGADNGSLAHRLLRQNLPTGQAEQVAEWSLEDIEGATGAVFIAGADTTWATCVIFILNMVLNQEVQRKAQNVLDEVVGTERLPDFGDRQKMPYVEWIVQEIYRSILYANAQAIGRDERVYSDPTSFRPERYQPRTEGGSGEPFPTAHFGFGRRVCVGRFLADNSVWIMVATMLATLSFQKAADNDGNPEDPRVEFTNGGTW
ncbi:hypothetical protein S7711_03546 [Stachybotrys chartarum IBT 7711]|uniref:Cytochrome P450 n=1 Tax=Stachybotrys chartarum (strain CBS 109288 / IBT 7711) TaxID=1280523 RepID=A0A084B1Q0_STACB|nr:hypothetical protein S7711_03546 [Stachybotrys chartarum IBT 7711]